MSYRPHPSHIFSSSDILHLHIFLVAFSSLASNFEVRKTLQISLKTLLHTVVLVQLTNHVGRSWRHPLPHMFREGELRAFGESSCLVRSLRTRRMPALSRFLATVARADVSSTGADQHAESVWRGRRWYALLLERRRCSMVSLGANCGCK